jgi:acyl-CoA thioesterase I
MSLTSNGGQAVRAPSWIRATFCEDLVRACVGESKPLYWEESRLSGSNMKLMALSSMVAAWFLVGGCSTVNDGRLPAEADQGVLKIACVGDSITFGSGVENRETNNYPAVLGRMLGSKFEVKNFGVSGTTVLKAGDHPYWQADAFKAVDDYRPNAIVLKLGTNDSKPQNWKYAARFEADLRELVDHFQALPSKPRIWLCLPVPVYETQWGINDAVVRGEIVPKIRRVAAEKKLPTIDLYAALSGKPDHFPDKVHPNAAGAGVIARVVYRALTGNEPAEQTEF